MREVPEFIIDKLCMLVLMTDRRTQFGTVKDRFPLLRESVLTFISGIDSGFVSNNSEDFRSYIEERVGKVIFGKSFAVRIRPDSIRLFVAGKEILERRSGWDIKRNVH